MKTNQSTFSLTPAKEIAEVTMISEHEYANDILEDIQGAIDIASQRGEYYTSYKYDRDRLPEQVFNELRKAGYEIEHHGDTSINVFWTL